MKKSELNKYIKENILSALFEEEESTEDIEKKTLAINALAAAKEKAGIEENKGEVPMELLKAIQKYANEDNGMGFQDALKNIKTALYKVNRETRGRMSEADAIPTSAGEMERGDDGKMYNVIASNHDRKMAMKNIIDVLAKDGISTDDAFAFIKTHREDIFSGDIDAYDEEDIRMNWGEYVSINSEDFGDLRESFQRFL